MSLTSENMTPADIAAVTGNNNGNGWDGNGAWWLIVLFLFAFAGNGWGNGFGNGGNGAVPYMVGTNTQADVQRGFDQTAIMSSLNGITSAVSNGFANAEISRCNGQTNILQALNTNQAATTAGMNSLAMGLQQCCCDNRAAVADLKYTVATEACADRAAVNDALQATLNTINGGIQSIKDQMCQDKIDAKNEEIASLRTQLSMKDLAASQGAQTAQILADNARQTGVLEDYLNPVARPAYIVANPNCCAPYTPSCGCGYAA